MAAIGMERDRTLTMLGSLSSIGAAVAGVGVGILFASELAPVAWPALAIGVIVHLYGMVGGVRVRGRHGYRPGSLETAGFWACWAIVAGLLVYAAIELAA
ncbi:hypothetical protein GCM10011515_15530 [Tsuneonella deserti]|uniref:Transmembrane protein n=1 Tax=Tsuneonella deserti TaxID=2035528 RepID=A0ABQ1S6H5_9SPHN|nr:hypothetical protein [Tsuneonella deserti]GGD96562.1 hypothetical protein GCM10011515_15530 [Tsuneonella deserti]